MRARWGCLFASAALLWLGPAHVQGFPGSGLFSRGNGQPPADQTGSVGGQYVYRLDPRSPREVRGTGGFQPVGENWDQDDLAFNMQRDFRTGHNGRAMENLPRFQSADRVFRTAYVSVVLNIETILSSSRRPEHPGWLFEIRATGHILDDFWPETECLALGGIRWVQIRRYRENYPESPWFENPTYDKEKFENPGFLDRYQVTRTNGGDPNYDRSFPTVLRGDDDDDDDDRSFADSGRSSTWTTNLLSGSDSQSLPPSGPGAPSGSGGSSSGYGTPGGSRPSSSFARTGGSNLPVSIRLLSASGPTGGSKTPGGLRSSRDSMSSSDSGSTMSSLSTSDSSVIASDTESESGSSLESAQSSLIGSVSGDSDSSDYEVVSESEDEYDDADEGYDGSISSLTDYRSTDDGYSTTSVSDEDSDYEILSGSESDSDRPSSAKKARRFGPSEEALRWMNFRTQSRIASIVGHFPQNFAVPSQSDDPNVPGPRAGRTLTQMESLDREIALTIQRYMDMGEAGLRDLLPGRDVAIRTWLDGANQAGCSHWPDQPDLQRRANAPSHDKGGSKIDRCTQLYSDLRTLLYRSWSKRTPRLSAENTNTQGLSADELRRLKDGKVDGLDCRALIMKIQAGSSNKENVGVSAPANTPNQGSAQEDDCARARRMVTPTRRPQSGGKQKHRAQRASQKPAEFIFYGDFLWPEEARAQGGFFSAVVPPPGPKYDVEGAVNEKAEDAAVDWESYLLLGHTLFGGAAKHAADVAGRETKGFSGVVYVVHATPNIVSFGRHAVAVGGIRWEQIMGWLQIPVGYRPPEGSASHQRATLQNLFTKALEGAKTPFTRNPDYDKRFDAYRTSTRVPRNLSRDREKLFQFMNETGQAVGWTGQFPLSKARAITSEASRAAKVDNKVPAPHSQSEWEKCKSYIEEHSVALACLPVVALLNLIPGAGEAADAAELAALSAGSVETIELEETMSSAMTSVSRGVAQLLRDVTKLRTA